MTKTTESEERLMGEIRPADLRDYNGPLYVRNNSSTFISFDDNKGNIFSLQQKGKDDSIAVLPLEVAKHPGIQKLWRRGDLTVSTDPAIEEELTLAETRFLANEAAKKADIESKMDPQSGDSDMIPVDCLHCGQLTFITAGEKKRGNQPTLCESHKHLSSQFVMEHYYDDKTSSEQVKWISTSVAPKVTGPKN